MRILLVEDDVTVGRLVKRVLTAEGFAVDLATTGEEGRLLAFVTLYDGIVLDLGLSDRHGLSIVQELRREGQATPVLILTGEGDESMIVRALDAGADDYMVKPVRNRELAARVRALVRRNGEPRREQLVLGPLVLNRLERQARIAGAPLELSPKEFALLEHLVLHAGEVVTRADLLEKVWDMHFDPSSNVVDVHVGRLRRKLAHFGDAVTIETRRGVGFVLVPATEG